MKDSSNLSTFEEAKQHMEELLEKDFYGEKNPLVIPRPVMKNFEKNFSQACVYLKELTGRNYILEEKNDELIIKSKFAKKIIDEFMIQSSAQSSVNINRLLDESLISEIHKNILENRDSWKFSSSIYYTNYDNQFMTYTLTKECDNEEKIIISFRSKETLQISLKKSYSDLTALRVCPEEQSLLYKAIMSNFDINNLWAEKVKSLLKTATK